MKLTGLEKKTDLLKMTSLINITIFRVIQIMIGVKSIKGGKSWGQMFDIIYLISRKEAKNILIELKIYCN